MATTLCTHKQCHPQSLPFDGVLNEYSTQEELYLASGGSQIVNAVLDGFTACVIAYGQTGSGKSYCLSSTPTPAVSAGFGARVSQEIFDRARADRDHDYCVTLSYVQVFEETIQDLLDPSNPTPLRMVEDAVVGSRLHGATHVKVVSQEQWAEAMPSLSPNPNPNPKSVLRWSKKERLTATRPLTPSAPTQLVLARF